MPNPDTNIHAPGEICGERPRQGWFPLDFRFVRSVTS